MSFDDLSDDVALAPADHATPQKDGNAVVITKSVSQIQAALAELDKIAETLPDLHANHPVDLVFDVTTTKGMAEAVAHRAAWREPRIAVEKYRKTAKSPVLVLGKAIDARAAWLTERLEAGELPVHEQIKVEEARKAQEKADREAAEFGRVVAMQEAVGEIAMLAMVNGMPSAKIAERLAALSIEALDIKVYQEMMPQAEAARTAAVTKLEQALKAAQWDEAEAKRRDDEAERLRAEQAEADAERARVSAAQAEEAKRLQEARDMIAKAEREAAERIEAERKKLVAERAAWLAEQEAAKPAAAAIAQTPAPAGYVEPATVMTTTAAAPYTEGRDSQHVVKAEPATTSADATDRENPADASPSVGSMGVGQPADAGAIRDNGRRLSAGEICRKLGFVVTVEFLRKLGFEPAERDRASSKYRECDLPAIGVALIAHIQKMLA